jgi:hypothetical protein
MHTHEDNFCTICGLDQGEPAWGEDGKTPSFTICYCCGVEFGYQDCLLEGIRKYRNEWLQAGSQWCEPKYKPLDWDLNEQLQQINQLYR